MRVPRVRYAADLLNSSFASADTCWPFSGGSGVTLILRIFTESPELPETHAQQRRAGVGQMAHATVAHTYCSRSICHRPRSCSRCSISSPSWMGTGYAIAQRAAEAPRHATSSYRPLPRGRKPWRAWRLLAAKRCRSPRTVCGDNAPRCLIKRRSRVCQQCRGLY